MFISTLSENLFEVMHLHKSKIYLSNISFLNDISRSSRFSRWLATVINRKWKAMFQKLAYFKLHWMVIRNQHSLNISTVFWILFKIRKKSSWYKPILLLFTPYFPYSLISAPSYAHSFFLNFLTHDLMFWKCNIFLARIVTASSWSDICIKFLAYSYIQMSLWKVSSKLKDKTLDIKTC